LSLLLLFPFGDFCGSPCSPYSFSNPFGYVPKGWGEMCITACAYTPHPLFYIVTELLLFTVAVYILYGLYKAVLKRYKSFKKQTTL